jgi:hypothetical protein
MRGRNPLCMEVEHIQRRWGGREGGEEGGEGREREGKWREGKEGGEGWMEGSEWKEPVGYRLPVMTHHVMYWAIICDRYWSDTLYCKCLSLCSKRSQT